jgi:hypothetical protein
MPKKHVDTKHRVEHSSNWETYIPPDSVDVKDDYIFEDQPFMQNNISMDESYPSSIRECDRKFLWAIIERACLDCFLTSRDIRRSALKYIFSDLDEEFSFVWVLNTLEKSDLKSYIRGKVEHLRNKK